jgi:hypothetical protein
MNFAWTKFSRASRTHACALDWGRVAEVKICKDDVRLFGMQNNWRENRGTVGWVKTSYSTNKFVLGCFKHSLEDALSDYILLKKISLFFLNPKPTLTTKF